MNRKPSKVRDDPLAAHFAYGRIDRAQYMAGREFQKHFAIVDGPPLRDGLTDGVLIAGKWLTRRYGALGKDGSALVHDMLIKAMSTKQIAASRGMAGEERYLAWRMGECLNCLAAIYGFSSGEKKIRADGTKAQIIGAP